MDWTVEYTERVEINSKGLINRPLAGSSAMWSNGLPSQEIRAQLDLP